MDMHGWASVWLVLAVAYTSSGEIRRAGWLDRLVLYHKNHFIDEVKQLAPINIQASIEKAPVGYVDSPAWEYASVARLLALLGASEAAGSVRAALRRALGAAAASNETLQASRRFMSRQKSYKFFPSLSQMHLSNMYYDVETDADYAPEEDSLGGIVSPTAVVLVRNPVEARLPSARISVNLLKDILEARAVAARKMPTTTTTSGWIWTTKSVTVSSETSVPTTESPVTGQTTAGSNATSPTTPGTNAIEPPAPGTNATEPAAPGTNATEPTAPGTNATEPAAPGTNATEPTAPGTNATEPTAPGTNDTEPTTPGTNATEPTAPGTNATEPAET